MKFTLDSTLASVLDEPMAKPILEKYVPDLYKNPMVSMVKGMSLSKLLAMPQAAQFGLTKEKVQTVLDEINKRMEK
ncbi:MAG: hypothetical protein BGO78_07645 [Chloroflexi bacterium 44-23]|nr:MAG: hypothetical protein BGO78_07645 [Chloroflexi bacterium 44-23]